MFSMQVISVSSRKCRYVRHITSIENSLDPT